MPRHEKFVIGWTDWGQMCGETAYRIMELIIKDRNDRGLFNGILRSAGAYIDDLHDNITAEYMETFTENTPWFFSLDADMAPDPWMFYALLDVADPVKRPIVSANYFGYFKTRLDSGGLASVWMKRYEDGYRSIEDHDIHAGVDPENPDLVEIDSSGMGFMLIHRSVFEKIKADSGEKFPNWRWFGREVLELDGKRIGRYGEDIAFCRRAQLSGFKIWGHGGVVVDHVKTRKENLQTFVERVEGRAAIRNNPQYEMLRSKLGDPPKPVEAPQSGRPLNRAERRRYEREQRNGMAG